MIRSIEGTLNGFARVKTGAFFDGMLAYLDELDCSGVVSRSHVTLGRLYKRFSKKRVNNFLDAYFGRE